MTTGRRVPVLDKGFVRLVGHHGDDLLVVNAARVSFAKESRWESDGDHAPQVLSAKDAKLIRYLAKHEHWTPFGHPQITLHFKWPVFCARQAMRSNIGICWNEVSRRYVDDMPEVHAIKEWRGRPEGSIKQGSGQPMEYTPFSWAGQTAEELCLVEYNRRIACGVAPEQAREVLPMGVFTEAWGTFSLAALARFYKLRSDSHAQLEIQQYAKAIDALVRPLFPVSWEALTGAPDA